MTDAKLKRYLQRELHAKEIKNDLILLTDSKGNYLQRHLTKYSTDFPAISKIHFESHSGRNLVQGLYWLQANIQRLLTCFNKLSIYVWLGTCDLTYKRGRYIYLQHRSDELCCSYISHIIERYYSFLASYSTVTVVFLYIPPYSIVHWNLKKGLPVSDNTRADDLILYNRVCLVNDFIRYCNDRRDVESPRFHLDLRNERKVAGKETRKSITYKKYLDGIHPDELLAEVWLKRIIERASLNSQK